MEGLCRDGIVELVERRGFATRYDRWQGFRRGLMRVEAVSRLSHNATVIQGLFSEVCMGDEGRSHSGRASFQNPGLIKSRCQTSQA